MLSDLHVSRGSEGGNTPNILFLELSDHSPEQAGHPSHRFDHPHFLVHGCVFESHHFLHAPEAVTEAVVGAKLVIFAVCAVL